MGSIFSRPLLIVVTNLQEPEANTFILLHKHSLFYKIIIRVIHKKM